MLLTLCILHVQKLQNEINCIKENHVRFISSAASDKDNESYFGVAVRLQKYHGQHFDMV